MLKNYYNLSKIVGIIDDWLIIYQVTFVVIIEDKKYNLNLLTDVKSRYSYFFYYNCLIYFFDFAVC